jgi:hypothetical protein
MKLLANENFPLPSVLFLRVLGYNITSIGEEYAGVSDEYVMDIADKNKEQSLPLTGTTAN